MEADGDGAVDAGLREIDAAVAIDGFDQLEIERVEIAGALPAHSGTTNSESEAGSLTISNSGARAQLLAKRARPGDMVADHGAQAFEAVGAQQEPELQRAELAPERNAPFAVVDDFARPNVCR